MGCCCATENKEDIKKNQSERYIRNFEKQLGIENAKINEIKLAFFNLYQSNDIINKNNLEIGLECLLVGVS